MYLNFIDWFLSILDTIVKEKQELYLNSVIKIDYRIKRAVKEKQELYLNDTLIKYCWLLDKVKEKQELYLNILHL